jgi:hypothetical protein
MIFHIMNLRKMDVGDINPNEADVIKIEEMVN